MPAHDRSHYDRSYKVRSRIVRAAAKANPATVCWRCGRTLAQVQQSLPLRRVFWTAGHTIAGDRQCALLPECSPCNFKDGQQRAMVARSSSGGTGRI